MSIEAGAAPAYGYVEPETHRFQQKATIGNMAPLAIKNAILGIITLTLYRFWARTDIRRRLWATTYILDDPLEYGGTGWELFRGFLITIPIFFVPAIFIFYIAPYVMNRETASLLALGFYIASVPLVALAVYLMRRYQLSRTRWRGIRLALDGSPLAYALASSGWTLIEYITLGWYAPEARMNRAKIIWENSRFGDQPFEFGVGEHRLAKGLAGPYAIAWFGLPLAFIAASIVTFIAISIAVVAFGVEFPVNSSATPPTGSALVAVIVTPLILLVVFALIYAFCLMPYQAAAMNRTAELLSIDGARFRLRAKSGGLYGVTLASVLVFILSLGLLAPLAGMFYVRYVLNRLEMIGVPRFADIGQNQTLTPKSGESFADAFDLDFGVGVI